MKLTQKRKIEILQDECCELQECNRNLEHGYNNLYNRILELERELFLLQDYVISMEMNNDDLQIKIKELTKLNEER